MEKTLKSLKSLRSLQSLKWRVVRELRVEAWCRWRARVGGLAWSIATITGGHGAQPGVEMRESESNRHGPRKWGAIASDDG
jgi:hypothetical protein